MAKARRRQSLVQQLLGVGYYRPRTTRGIPYDTAKQSFMHRLELASLASPLSWVQQFGTGLGHGRLIANLFRGNQQKAAQQKAARLKASSWNNVAQRRRMGMAAAWAGSGPQAPPFAKMTARGPKLPLPTPKYPPRTPTLQKRTPVTWYYGQKRGQPRKATIAPPQTLPGGNLPTGTGQIGRQTTLLYKAPLPPARPTRRIPSPAAGQTQLNTPKFRDDIPGFLARGGKMTELDPLGPRRQTPPASRTDLRKTGMESKSTRLHHGGSTRLSQSRSRTAIQPRETTPDSGKTSLSETAPLRDKHGNRDKFEAALDDLGGKIEEMTEAARKLTDELIKVSSVRPAESSARSRLEQTRAMRG